MTCNCIEDNKINFKVSVDPISENEIVILDRSSWVIQEDKDTSFEATIIHAKGQERVVNLNRSTIKNLKSSEFGDKFCDGIYCIKTESCGIHYTEYFAITEKLYCGLYNLSLKDLKLAKEVKDNIDSIHTLVESKYKEKALELYKITEKILSYHNCTCK